MNEKLNRIAVAIFLASLLASAPWGALAVAVPPASALPLWPMFKNGSARTSITTRLGPQANAVAWDHKLPHPGIQSPAVIGRDGTIYVGSVVGVFYAFAPNGNLRWGHAISKFEITAAPAIARDGTVYVSPENGDLHAFDPAGNQKWIFKLKGYGGPSSSPAIAQDGTIYVGADAFYAIRPDGRRRWAFHPGSYINGPAAIASDGTIYFPSQDYLYALYPNGQLRWRFTVRGAYPPGSAPAIGSDGTIYVNTHDGVLHAIRPDGTEAWKYGTPGIVVDVPSSPAIGADGTIYFGGAGEYQGRGGYFFALNPDGTLKWKYFAGCDQTAPSIGGDGTIYFANDACGSILALNPDGSLKWGHYQNAYTRSAPAIGIGRLYTGYLADPNVSPYGGLLALGEP